MDVDHCVTVFWSAITASNADSTVAGVLAGLLIAAVAALLVQSYQGADAHTIALFGSGVPALALCTYLFTVIGGSNYQEYYPVSSAHPRGEAVDYKTPGADVKNLCSQLWSEWVLAIGLLFIGTAVLLCGLAWALASYADNLAVKLCTRDTQLEIVEQRRGFFIRLNAWLSGAAITTATALVVSADVIYLATIDRADLHWRVFGQTWYLLFLIYFLGVFFIGRSSYEIFRRTRSALRANEDSCAAYAPADSSVSPVDDREPALRNELTMRVAHEVTAVLWVAVAALLAGYMTSGEAFYQPRGFTVNPTIAIQVVVFYAIARTAYVLVTGTAKLVFAQRGDTSTRDIATPAAPEGKEERIRIKYSVGVLGATAFGVVLLAILGTFFVVGLTQGPFWTPLRISVSLLLGGLYPAVVLTALSSSVPGADDAASLYEREWTSRVVRAILQRLPAVHVGWPHPWPARPILK